MDTARHRSALPSPANHMHRGGNATTGTQSLCRLRFRGAPSHDRRASSSHLNISSQAPAIIVSSGAGGGGTNSGADRTPHTHDPSATDGTPWRHEPVCEQRVEAQQPSELCWYRVPALQPFLRAAVVSEQSGVRGDQISAADRAVIWQPDRRHVTKWFAVMFSRHRPTGAHAFPALAPRAAPRTCSSGGWRP